MKYEFHIDESCPDKELSILSDYWNFDFKYNQFIYKASEIKQKYDIEQQELTALVKQYSWAEREDFVCENCRKKEKFTSRSSLVSFRYANTDVKVRGYGKNKTAICFSCDEKAQAQAQAKAKEEVEKARANAPYSMFDEWQPTIKLPEIKEKLNLSPDNEEITDTLNSYFRSFKDFYFFKPHIKKMHSGWDATFLEHCRKNLAWANGEATPGIKEKYFSELNKLWAQFENSFFNNETELKELQKKIENAIIKIEKNHYRYEDYLKWRLTEKIKKQNPDKKISMGEIPVIENPFE